MREFSRRVFEVPGVRDRDRPTFFREIVANIPLLCFREFNVASSADGFVRVELFHFLVEVKSLCGNEAVDVELA